MVGELTLELRADVVALREAIDKARRLVDAGAVKCAEAVLRNAEVGVMLDGVVVGSLKPFEEYDLFDQLEDNPLCPDPRFPGRE